MGNTTMPSPWDSTPQEQWAQNFRDRISAVTSNIEDSGVEDYKAGVEAAFERAGVDMDADDVSVAVSRFEDSVENFSDEAMKRTTVVAAAQYLENNDVPDDLDTGSVPGSTEYDSASADEFEAATRILGDKFINNWADSYTADS